MMVVVVTRVIRRRRRRFVFQLHSSSSPTVKGTSTSAWEEKKRDRKVVKLQGNQVGKQGDHAPII